MNDTPFDTIGDEPVEARIVAWVLGESSAFEAAELERLCEERPELLVFRRRMRALHGLLTEAEAAEPDHSWKLPPEKRKLLDEIFGEETVVRLDASKELRIRRNGRRAMLAIAACVAITFFITRLTPWKHEAEAIIEVKPRSMGMSPFGGNSMGAPSSKSLTPQFFGTEFEKIKSRNSLEKVVDNLDLAKRWNMDKESALKRVKDSIETRNLDGTDLISIRVRDASERDAQEITQQVVESYKEYRSGIEKREAEKGLAELKKAVRDQEDKVEERRKTLATIVRTKGIIHDDSYYGQSGVDDDQGARKTLESYDQLLRDKNQLEGQINSLLKYDSDQLMNYASGLDLPDNVIRNVHPLYLEAKRHLEDLKIKGEGDKHPEVVAAENQIQAMKHQLDEGVVSLRENLKAKLDTANDSLKSVGTMKDGAHEDAIKRGLDAQGYVDAKREYEADQQLLQSMKLKQINESITSKMTEESIVVHEMTPPLESKKSKSEAKASAASARKSEVALNLKEQKGGIDILGGSSFGLGDKRSDGTAKPESLPAVRGMIVDREEKIEEERAVADSPVRAKASDVSLARNESSSKFFDKEVQKAKPASSQPPAPTAAPAAPPAGTGNDDSFAMSSTRRAGLKENARQLQLAKQPSTTQPRAFAEGAAQALPALDAPSEVEALPEITTRNGLGGGAGFGDARMRIVPPPTQTAAPEPELAQLLAKDSAPAAGARSTVAMKMEMETLKEIPADRSLALADRLDTDGDENGLPLAGDGVTSGLRSGDQAINRNSIDAILNNPGRDAPGANKAKALKSESDAKPPVLADSESTAPTEPARKPAALGGALTTWGGTMPGLAEAGKKLEAVESLGDDSTRLADGSDWSSKKDVGELPAQHAQAVDQVRRNLYTAEGNYNLGKYDDAKKSYQDALKVDPYNSAARRGLEQVEVAKSDYYRASYDHTRAELLSQVDSAWELSVPADGKNLETRFAYQLSDRDRASESKELDMVARFRGEAKASLGLDRKPAEIEVGREFQFPTEFEAPELPKGEVAVDGPAMKETATKAADLAEHQQKLATLRKQLEDNTSENNKQALFKEWKKLKKEIVEMTDEGSLAEIDEPQAKLTDLMEEIPATENPYSTFSLNINDASFQLAKAALAKGERPDPESIKPEQFYNAVDYGDPAPSSNEPVAATIEQSAHPIIPGRNLVRVALRTGSAGRSAAQPLRLTLLVDQSGSMVREDRRASMEHALAQLGILLTKADLVTVIGFSRIPHLLAESMTGDQAAKLNDLVNQTASEGGTNLEEAMILGAEKALSHQLAGAQNRIVLFTDGAANLGNANREHLAAQVKALRQKGIAFDIAGIGTDGLNDPLLSDLARNGNGRYYVVGSENNDSFARQLAGAFRPAAENVKVQVNFNPQRVGKYKLIGFEKDRLKTEDFRNDAVDAAELAAEEAGVAIYQVEPLTEGTGELGEVSVRFRDAASGQMVERAWTIPYAAQATAFDRATPSMQLAGLSLLAAEKLKDGPLADAIDFKQLTGPGAFVKQFYGSSPRVADMLQVIEKLK